jgi:pyridoxamine 5'-phosphate oxidase
LQKEGFHDNHHDSKARKSLILAKLSRMDSIADIRKDYKLQSLEEKDVAADPFTQFGAWWQQATDSQIDEVNAMTLCTVAENGRPQGRIVLLKGYDENGFVFFTNYQSNKGNQLAQTPFATLVFFWKELERQVRITGTVSQVSGAESDAYFAIRPKKSQLGAIASPQSRHIDSREILEENMAVLEEKYAEGEIPRPAHWGGYRVLPDAVEFWQGRRSRLHDRILYTQTESGWSIERLAP